MFEICGFVFVWFRLFLSSRFMSESRLVCSIVVVVLVLVWFAVVSCSN